MFTHEVGSPLHRVLGCQVIGKGTHRLRQKVEATAHTRIPAGHPEGYLEAFANIYRNFAICLRAHLKGEKPDPVYQDFPSVEDGVRGMRFIERVVESSNSEEKWLAF